MTSRTVEAKDAEGTVVGAVIVPERGKRALWPRTVEITWECAVADCIVGGDDTTTEGAIAALAGHLESEHKIEVSGLEADPVD
jgi:hypothetical protein